MSHSIRFLGIAILAWAGVRAVSLGLVPGTQALAFDAPPPAKAATIPATNVPPIDPPVDQAAPLPGQMAMGYGGYPPPYGARYGDYPPQPVCPLSGLCPGPRSRLSPERASGSS